MVVLVIAAMTQIRYVLCSVLADDDTLSTEILEFIAENIHTTGSPGVKITFERMSRTFVIDANVSSCGFVWVRVLTSLRPSLYCTTVYPYLESPSKPHSSTTTKRAQYDSTINSQAYLIASGKGGIARASEGWRGLLYGLLYSEEGRSQVFVI